jgi:hypothetical protein
MPRGANPAWILAKPILTPRGYDPAFDEAVIPRHQPDPIHVVKI